MARTGPTGRIAYREDGVWCYVQKDHLESTPLVFRGSGVAQTTCDHDMYGTLGRSTVSVRPRYHITWQEYDAEVRMMYLRARRHDHQLGLFWQNHPVGIRCHRFLHKIEQYRKPTKRLTIQLHCGGGSLC